MKKGDKYTYLNYKMETVKILSDANLCKACPLDHINQTAACGNPLSSRGILNHLHCTYVNCVVLADLDFILIVF